MSNAKLNPDRLYAFSLLVNLRTQQENMPLELPEEMANEYSDYFCRGDNQTAESGPAQQRRQLLMAAAAGQEKICYKVLVWVAG